MYNFNSLADLYSKNIKPIPSKYIDLIKNIFFLEYDDRILDVGCGSGTISLPLSKTINYVEGIDLSENMINIAKRNDIKRQVIWRTGDINEEILKNDFYKLVITYETIHLLPNKNEILQKFESCLKNNGYFCIGYCIYNWEKTLYKDILGILNSHNINISNWFFQKAEDTVTIFNREKIIHMSTIKEHSIKVEECWNAAEIANYIVSTSIFLDVKPEVINNIKKELIDMITNQYQYNFIGESEYIIKYSKKH